MPMTIRLENALCVDGVGKSEIRNVLLQGPNIAEDSVSLASDKVASRAVCYDLSGCLVVSGGIDLHTHIGGGKVNVARLLLPELVQNSRSSTQLVAERHEAIGPLSSPVPGTLETGRRYLQMGYTACFEPAVLPANARHAHAEMADTPWLDTGGYLLMGNDRLLLDWIRCGVPQQQINDYVAWMIRAHQCCAVKVVNAGGIDAFKFNQRSLDVDDLHIHFQITPRQILKSLATAVEAIGLAHPLHVHCSNLGVAGNIASTLATIDAVEGRRLHLTHAQFHCYGKDGPHGYSSAASLLADRVNSSPNLSIDIGHDQYVHGLLWTIGLELFLRVQDPMRVFLTTDHPNGAPFTAYPHLIRLLMSYDYRMGVFERLHPEVRATSSLPSLRREYTLEEIVKMTRLGPAKAIGLADRGDLVPGSLADVVVYERNDNPEAMFANPKMVFRRGELVYQDGKWLAPSVKSTIVSKVELEDAMDARLRRIWRSQYGYSIDTIRIRDEELMALDRQIEPALLR